MRRSAIVGLRRRRRAASITASRSRAFARKRRSTARVTPGGRVPKQRGDQFGERSPATLRAELTAARRVATSGEWSARSTSWSAFITDGQAVTAMGAWSSPTNAARYHGRRVSASRPIGALRRGSDGSRTVEQVPLARVAPRPAVGESVEDNTTDERGTAEKRSLARCHRACRGHPCDSLYARGRRDHGVRVGLGERDELIQR